LQHALQRRPQPHVAALLIQLGDIAKTDRRLTLRFFWLPTRRAQRVRTAFHMVVHLIRQSRKPRHGYLFIPA
jgi:hypothetical protein